MADNPSEIRAALDAATAGALPIAGGPVLKRLKQLRRSLDEVPANRPAGDWEAGPAYRIYSLWHRKGDRSARSVWAAIQEAYKAGRESRD